MTGQVLPVSERLMTETEWAQWEEDGFLFIRGVLEESEVKRLLADVTRLVGDFERLSVTERTSFEAESGNAGDLRIKNVVSLSRSLDGILDHPAVFSKVVALMGPYLRICSTEILVRRSRQSVALGFHRDGGPSLQRILPHPGGAALFVKALFFLTDVSARGRGNVIVIPRSHDTQFGAEGEDSSWVEVDVVAKAGDVLLFPWSLWHAVGPNLSTEPRVSAVVWYSQRWACPVDYFRVGRSVLDRLSARQRLLFAAIDDQAIPEAAYMPLEDDYLSTMLGPWKEALEVAPYINADETFHRGDAVES
jgi:hypothetical protein